MKLYVVYEMGHFLLGYISLMVGSLLFPVSFYILSRTETWKKVIGAVMLLLSLALLCMFAGTLIAMRIRTA